MFFYKSFFLDLLKHRKLILELAKREYKSTYIGSALGILWSFIEPLVYVLIMWFFFTKAVSYKPAGDIPYLPWLTTSLFFWYFISAGINGSSSIFKSYSYMLKRWDFNMSILPVVSILSALFNHLIFLIILGLIYAFYGMHFSFFFIQVIYYLFCLFVFLVGLSWITASLSLFYKDIRNIINISLQILFWVSPIFWEIASFPERFHKMIKLNPLYHIISGYRNTFINHVPFWTDFNSMIYFWFFCMCLWLVGGYTYKNLRPHFGEII